MSMTTNEVYLIYLICFGGPLTVLFFSWIWLFYKTKEDRNDNDHDYIHNAVGHYLRMRLSLDDCIELYNKKFDSNGNQLILQSKHIVTKVIKQSSTNNITEKLEDKAQTITIESSSFVDVELGGNDGNKNNDDDDDDDDDVDDDVVDDDDNCDVDDIDNIDAMDDIDVGDDNDNDDLDDTTMTTSLRLDHNQEKQQLGINSGTCIICIEDFVTNDVIVWSEDPSCSHIYHKTCMVQYLSSNAKLTTKQARLSSNLTSIPILDVSTNPCPTCRRQKFCSIRDEDILQHYS